MKKFFSKLKSLIPTKRKLIQLYSALLFNANIKGFVSGKIYKGATKNVCAPGINCYSCPSAVGACPLGALQNALGASQHRAPFYVIGILMLYALLFGRFICGFLCPFGLIQELLYKIKTPKLKKSRVTRILSYLKYVILVFFVVFIPLVYFAPGFCKYICPAGVLEGAFGVLGHPDNANEMSRLGPLFTWKFLLLISILLGSVFIFRIFCRFLCPLGALYGLFNHFSVFGIKLEKHKCTDCGLCVSKCKVDIRHVNDHECINCGECIDVCPTQAISWKGSKIFLPPNEISDPVSINENSTEEEIALANQQRAEFEAQNARIKKRNKILKIVAGCVMLGVLAFALIYYNFIDTPNEDVKPKPPTNQQIEEGAPPLGIEVGNTCYGFEMEVFDENGLTGEKFDPANNHGKITIINFWGTWCSGCVDELPYFDRIATEYKDTVTVVAVHTSRDFLDGNPPAKDFVMTNYKDSNIIFTRDEALDKEDKYSDDYYFKLLGGGDSYPITIILDEKGVIISANYKDMTYNELKEIIDSQLTK
ncbi:MAG: 4Fe-4S binding protein [Clostridia bacterium]|nr:4Fe-4S binding protein [Clostridia bacterium]